MNNLYDVCKAAVEFYGRDAQARQTSEECLELALALHHLNRDKATLDDVASEVADVEIMCRQMRMIIGEDKVEAAKQEKLDRLMDRLEQARLDLRIFSSR